MARLRPPAPVPPPRPRPKPTARPGPVAPRYAALFNRLLRRIERYEVFPPAYVQDVGHPWKSDVPRLREEFLHARSRKDALVALWHLENSLRNPHCWLDPPADLERHRLRLGLHLWAGGTAKAPDVRVADLYGAAAKRALSVGDELVAVDGVPIASWFDQHRFDSSWLEPGLALGETAERIVDARPPWSHVKVGDTRVLTVMHDGAKKRVKLAFRAHFPSVQRPDLDHPPPMASISCNDADKPAYGDYVPVATGVNVCVYAPRHPNGKRVRIVRYLSFYYNGPPAQALRMVKVDHDLLARELRHAGRVIVDLHENEGGNNPFLFLGWFTGVSWDHPRVVTRVVPDLDDSAVQRLLWGDQAAVSAYESAQKAGRTSVETRFLCDGGRCTGDHGLPADRVTRAPVALLVGPRCVSSCDQLAVTWASFHAGRIVGRQPAHAYTVNRWRFHVAGPDGEDLGFFRIGLSRSAFSAGMPLEGKPLALDWQAPSTFKTRRSWVGEAVSHAVKLLAHPLPAPHTAPARRVVH